MKAAICQDAIIHAPDFNSPFILQTDASNTAVRVVLTQHDQGIERLMAYASHKLLPTKTGHVTIMRECLAIRWATGYFHCYLMEREFQLVMNHASLRWLSHTQTDNAYTTHWGLALKPCKFTVVHRPGGDNAMADLLSRCRDMEVNSNRDSQILEEGIDAGNEENHRQGACLRCLREEWMLVISPVNISS